jgi:hypothetical protein
MRTSAALTECRKMALNDSVWKLSNHQSMRGGKNPADF